VFNFVAGATFLLAFPHAAPVLHLDATLYASQARLFIETFGMVILLLGVAYLSAAFDPLRFRLCIMAGIVTKASFFVIVAANRIADVVDDRMLILASVD